MPQGSWRGEVYSPSSRRKLQKTKTPQHPIKLYRIHVWGGDVTRDRAWQGWLGKEAGFVKCKLLGQCGDPFAGLLPSSCEDADGIKEERLSRKPTIVRESVQQPTSNDAYFYFCFLLAFFLWPKFTAELVFPLHIFPRFFP